MQNSGTLKRVVLETLMKSGILSANESALPADSDPRLQTLLLGFCEVVTQNVCVSVSKL